MNINKYINWNEIWIEEVCIDKELNILEDIYNVNPILINTIKQFIEDKDVQLLFDECYMDDDKLIFCFGETGGQNESDNQGWSRDYTFIVDPDFMIINAEYSQG